MLGFRVLGLREFREFWGLRVEGIWGFGNFGFGV